MRPAGIIGVSLVCAALAGVRTARAQGPAPGPRVRAQLQLDAGYDPSARRLTGTARWVIPNVSERALTDVVFWLYPNRLRDRPAALGDVNFHWLYPNGFSQAVMHIGAARVGATDAAVELESSGAGPDTVARVKLPIPLAPGAAVAISLDFTTDLPVRLGGFGCAAADGRACRMMGGFYPFPLHLGPQGFQNDAPPDRIDFAARVSVPPGAEALLGDVSRVDTHPGSPLQSAEVNAPYVTLLIDRGLRPDSIDAHPGRATFFHHGARPPSSSDQVLPYVREDRVGLVLDNARRALAFIGGAGVANTGVSEAGRRPVVLVEAPLRHELVQVHGDVILVSDRLFEIFPLERLRRFHRLALVRAVLATVVSRVIRDSESDPDIDLSADVISTYLTEVFAQGEFHRFEFAPDMLRPFSFIPAVDQLIHAPLVASSSSYFGDLDDRDVVRDDVRRFSHMRGNGRLVYSKLLDLVGPSGMRRLTQLVLRERVPLRQAATRVFGSPLDWFWRQWVEGPLPRVNYRLEAVRTAPLSLPAGVGRAVHVIVDIQRQGDDLIEPVEVRIIDRAGAAHDLVWSQEGPAHRFELDLPDGLASVEVDPRHRLIETSVGSLDSSDDPLVDNRRPKTWRFIYSGAGALLDVTALKASFAAAVRVKPRHDLRNSILLLAYRSPSTVVGVESAYTRLFGPQADRNRLASSVGASLSASQLEPNFGVASTETLRPRWRLTGGLFTEYDDRDYFIDPWRAIGMSAGITYALTGLENGGRLSQVNFGIELLRLFELRPGHVLAFDGQAGVALGDIRVRSQLGQIGGPTALRGFAADELFGRGQAVARIELRDRYVSDLDWNLAHFTSVRGFGGNLFLETGAVTSCDDLSVGKNDVFTDVGYSFRVLHDAFGVYQQLLSIDVAVPLNRHDRVCAGWHSLGAPDDPSMRTRRPAFVVLISFLPTF